MKYIDFKNRFKEIDESVKSDPKLIIDTLLHYFGDAQTLWFLVHEHITDFNYPGQINAEHRLVNINDLQKAYNSAVNNVIEQEFTLNEDS